jgi:uncharacterized protein (UPF0276 family)
VLTGLGIGHLPILHDDLLQNKNYFDFVEITPESYIGGDTGLMSEQLTAVSEILRQLVTGLICRFAPLIQSIRCFLANVKKSLNFANQVSSASTWHLPAVNKPMQTSTSLHFMSKMK